MGRCVLALCRIPVTDPVPDDVSGQSIIMSSQEYKQRRYHTKYDPIHIDGVPTYSPGETCRAP
jgi:hypothetical protein